MAKFERQPVSQGTTAGKSSHREQQFLRLWRLLAKRRPLPVTQHRFHETRKWRFDFAWVEQRVAVEIDGGTRGRPVTCHQCGATVRARKKGGKLGSEIRLGGGHNRGPAFAAALEKQNQAVLLGWRVVRVTERDLDARPAQTVELVAAVLDSTQRRGDAEERSGSA